MEILDTERDYGEFIGRIPWRAIRLFAHDNFKGRDRRQECIDILLNVDRSVTNFRNEVIRASYKKQREAIKTERKGKRKK